MKNLHKWVAIAMSAVMLSVCLTACDDDDDELTSVDDVENEEDVVTEISAVAVSPTSISESAEGGITTVKVTSNTSWSVSVPSDASWVSVSVASGTGDADVIVNVAANESESSRSTTVTIATDDTEANCTLSISQSAASTGGDEDDEDEDEDEDAEPSISVNPTSISMDAEGGSSTVAITANVDWTIYSMDGSDDWVTLSSASGSGSGDITLTVAQNTETSTRTVSYVVSAADDSGVSASLTVVQSGAASSTLSVSFQYSSLEVPAAGAGYSGDYGDVEFYVLVEGTTEAPVLTCDNSAFTVELTNSSSSQMGSGTEYWYVLLADANTSDYAITGTITVKVGDYTGYISVTQLSASGSTAGEGEYEAYISFNTLKSLFGGSTVSFVAGENEYWELYSTDDNGDNGIMIDFMSGCKWYYGYFSQRLQFESGAKFAFCNSSTTDEYITYKKIELLGSSEFSSNWISADSGSVAVTDDVDTSDNKTYKCTAWTGSAKTVTFTVSSSDCFIVAFRIIYEIDED